MKTQHTPGPWTAESEKDFSPDRQYDECWTVISGGGILTVAAIEQHDGEAAANARLIASAPELLSALELAHRALVICNSNHGIGTLPAASERADIEAATMLARQAIARATAQ